MKVAYRINGKTVSRKEFTRKRAKSGGVPMVGSASAWPMKSDIALRCHPDQVQEFNAIYAQRGITGARHLPNGACEITCNNARNQVLRAWQLKDNDAGYGQYAGK
jgi:hypothetical protein